MPQRGPPKQPPFAVATRPTHGDTDGLLAVALAYQASVVGDPNPMGYWYKTGTSNILNPCFKTSPHITVQNPRPMTKQGSLCLTLWTVIMQVLTLDQNPQPTSPAGDKI